MWSDNINVNDVCFSLFVLPVADRIQDTVVQDYYFWQKVKVEKKKRKKKKSSISRQMDVQGKTNAGRSSETEIYFFCLDL